jgi:3-hydroxyisobutyrate dehydrogenase-like beta-hydroxyacid dehydrogenase
MGEMGSGVARRLIERGARVLTSLDGRSGASRERAQAAGAEILSDSELVAQTEILLSIVPPSAAAATAERFVGIIEQSMNKPAFIDCNAIAPQTLHEISAPFLQRGLRFGDASIIGLPPKADGYSPRLYMSGDIAREAASVKSLGLETRVISGVLGDASAIKMAYAGITKGFQAIGASMALGAARAGAIDCLVAELRDTQPQLYAWLSKVLPVMYAKAYRWDDEMREIAKFLEPERGAADMLMGAGTLYRHVAQDNVAGPQSEIVSILDRFVHPKTGSLQHG